MGLILFQLKIISLQRIIYTMEIKPYSKKSSKKQQVEQMFNKVSKKYDILNRILSFGIDKGWRNKVFKIVKKSNPKSILDIATGTGDLAIKLSKITNVIGIDISKGMLEVGEEKIKQKKLTERIILKLADAENLPFKDNSFDTITVAFGVRNFENLEKGINEIKRVLKNNGKLIVLEFSQPKNIIVSSIYNLYSKYFMPFVGGIISKDKKAYKYLDESSRKFISGEKFLNLLEHIGLKNNKCKRLTFGIASIYTGEK